MTEPRAVKQEAGISGEMIVKALRQFENKTGLEVISIQIERGGVTYAVIGAVPEIANVRLEVRL